MKIILGVINFRNLTGSELYVYELGTELVRQGHEVMIASRVIGGEIATRARKNGIELYDFENCPPDWGPDILHLSEYLPAAFLLNYFPSCPAVTTIHSQYAVERPFISDRIYHYICIRPEVQEVAVRQYGIDSKKTSVIYNGVNFERFGRIRSLPKPTNRKVLFVGTIDPLRKKSILHLIKKAKEEAFTVRIVGAKHADYLDNVPEHVEVLPATWDVEKYLEDVTETAGILLGRTTIEGWVAGRDGWIYDVDLNGEIKSVKLHKPPKDLDERFNIKNVAKKMTALYEDAIHQNGVRKMENSDTLLVDAVHASATAVGLCGVHAVAIGDMDYLIRITGDELVRQDRERLALQERINRLEHRLVVAERFIPIRVARYLKAHLLRK